MTKKTADQLENAVNLCKELAAMLETVLAKTPHFKGCAFYHASPCSCALLKARMLAHEVKEL